MKSLKLVFLVATISLVLAGIQSIVSTTPDGKGPDSWMAKEAITTRNVGMMAKQNEGMSLGGEVSLLKEEFSELKMELGHLKKQIAGLSSEIAGLTRPHTNEEHPLETDEEIAENLDLKAEKADQAFEQRMVAIENSWHHESIDPQWSDQSTETIHQAFDHEELKDLGVLESVDCRSTLCRVQVYHDNPLKEGKFQTSFALEVADNLPKMTMQRSENDDGTVNTVLFIARKGYELPDLEPDI